MGSVFFGSQMLAFRLVRGVPKLLADRTDDELMTLAQAGEREAFPVLVERHAEWLLFLSTRFVTDPDVGAELAQGHEGRRERHRRAGRRLPMCIRRVFLALVAMVVSVMASSPGRADSIPPRRIAFAVVIGNNKSLEHRRPDLHYADDDAARYYSILRTLAPDGAYLLTEFDSDTVRLMPSVGTLALPPTRAEVQKVGQEIASRMRASTTAQAETELYFIFAGHGDVDEGTGFIELGDARFTSADLEQWLRAIPFTRAHVILDSCNSFFMLSERRPGGHYYATAADAARSLASRLPNVGVFLSTSAEGESFEWSEIQSGVFSHIVRSGLLGAADANGDGSVSYLELAAFVSTATADVVNPNMRPHIFSRGPGGHDEQPIACLCGRSRARTFRLSDAAPLRIRVLDRDSVPLVDANQDGGVALTLALPEEWTDRATVERAGAGGSDASLQIFAVPAATSVVTLASLQPVATRGGTRGPAEVFQHLFVRPFGPRAVEAYVAEVQAAPAPIYGVSREDAERMDLLLGQIERAEHGRRMVAGSFFFAGAAYFAGLGATAIAFDRSDPRTTKSAADTAGAISLGIGALSLASGIYAFARPWSGERLATDYRDARRRNDYAHAFALANERIEALAAAEKRERWLRGIAGGVAVLGSTAILVGNELSNPSIAERFDFRAIGGCGVVLGLTSIAAAFFVESPTEHLTTVWREDPGRIRILPSATPTTGGATFGLSGTF
jgi:hypothetical protein